MDKAAKDLLRYAESLGVEARYRLPRRNHARIYLTYQGREMFVVMSSTPSCHRGIKNKRRDIRHAVAKLKNGEGRRKD